jgi:hypothetical protein
MRLWPRKKRIKPISELSTDDAILDSWADLMHQSMLLDSEYVDANGVSDRTETLQKINALRHGAHSIRLQSRCY